MGSPAGAEGRGPGRGGDGAPASSGPSTTEEFLKERKAIYQHKADHLLSPIPRVWGGCLLLCVARGHEFQRQYSVDHQNGTHLSETFLMHVNVRNKTKFRF